jgi:uncharacterized protein YegL
MGRKRKYLKTEIVCVLDKSGSMYSLQHDTIQGFNKFLEEQKTVKGEANLTLVLFDTAYRFLYDGVDIKTVAPLTVKTYAPDGLTALLDAVGRTIDTVNKRIQSINLPKDRPDKVIFMIMTDGEENASVEYKLEQVKEKITKYTGDGWDFIFLGANIDAFNAGLGLGVRGGNIAQYTATSDGISIVFDGLNRYSTSLRTSASVDGWKDTIK